MATGTVLPYSEYRKRPDDDPNKYEMLGGVAISAASTRSWEYRSIGWSI